MATYELSDDSGSATFEADDDDQAIERAEELLADFDLESDRETIYVTGYVSGPDMDPVRLKVRVDPTEPRCTGNFHVWERPISLVGGLEENPGVHGHGGGVTIAEVCMQCGTKRITDTWGDDGSGGHAETISYRYRMFRDEVEQLAADEEDAP